MKISRFIYVESILGLAGAAFGAVVGSACLWHEKFRVKHFSDTSYVKKTLNCQFAALSYHQVSKISAIFGGSLLALAGLSIILTQEQEYTKEVQYGTCITVLLASALLGGLYFYTRKINVLKIGLTVASSLCCGIPLIASFAIKYFTQKKLFG